ncbi:ATP-binding protein [Halorussus halophilus]|uniref:ATP-binding protein n=1 Tax=Halorussus halophilus TaxID=2650975 RepID=UPI001CE4A3D1|nr:hypothetical protein [Halorussus halophilus]
MAKSTPPSNSDPEASTPETDTGDPTRTYIQINPTDSALNAKTVESQFRRLQQLRPTDTGSGLLSRFRTATPPTLEFLLVSEHEPYSTLTYYVGIENGDIDELDRLLRSVFPNTYEFSQVDWHPNQLTPSDDSTEQDDGDSPDIAGVEFWGDAERRRDWQTKLTSFAEFTNDDNDDHARIPLAGVIETMAEHDVTLVYQTLLRPKEAWTAELEDRLLDIEMNVDTVGGKIANAIFGTPENPSLTSSDEDRIEELEEKDARRSFDVNARAIALDNTGTDTYADRSVDAVRELTAAFSGVSYNTYEIESKVRTDTEAEDVFEMIRDRTFHPPDYERWTTKLPLTTNRSRGVVADVSEAPSFCLLDGAALPTAGSRALAPSRGEQTALPRPPEEILDQYRNGGFTLGQPLSQDDTPTPLIALPPALQPLHMAIFGKTGSGKSTVLTRGIRDNHAATDGPSILIEPKGDGMPVEYLRAHYAKYGNLENVYYFDCAEVLPALSFFDIRPELAAGIDRATAVQNKVDHYIELLVSIMGRDRFERAVRSPDIIRYLVKALFDPVHGSDAYTHREFQQAARQMAETRDAPPVTDEDLEVMLGGVVTNSKRSFDELMQGVLNRIEKIPLDDRLALLFNHVPRNETETESEDEPDPQFDFADVLDEDAVVIFDTSGLRKESRKALTTVLLSNLWTSLQRRQRQHESNDGDDEMALVNLYVEEAAEVAASGLMTELLAKSRSFNLSVTLAMQFPAQVRNADTEAYAEILNNISTFLTGNVSVDRDLEKRLATEDIPPSEVGNRLRALRRGQWFASLPAGFQDREPRPFLLSSAPLPAGHPESDSPLSETQRMAFEALFDSVRDDTRLHHGLDFKRQGQAQSSPTSRSSSSVSAHTGTNAGESSTGRVDSALPYTKRLPVCIRYDSDVHAIVCTGCESRHDPSPAGVKRGIECCSSLDRIDRDNVPISDINLTLSAAEREASEYSDRQLAFLQAVYAAHQGEYDPEWEYDIGWDSMLRLQEYVGIDPEAVEELLEDGLLAVDCDSPHRLYTVTADGRAEIQVAYREGIAYGHGVGDLGESSLHRVMVDFGRRYIEAEYANSSDSDVVEVVPYYELEDGHRLDIAGLDANGEVRAVVEAERVNNDVLRAVPEDYDKMAGVDPEDAIWIVRSRDDAHNVLEALNDPPTGDQRVEKTYSRSSPPQRFKLDAAGCSQIHTLRYLRESLLELSPPA